MANLASTKTLKLQGEVGAIAWSPDGKLLATSEAFNRIIEVWDVETGNKLNTIQKQASNAPRILFTPDGKSLIVPSTAPVDGVSRAALSIIDVRTGQDIRSVQGPNDPSHFPLANQPRDFRLSPDGRRLFVTFNAREPGVYFYDTSIWNQVGVLPIYGFVMQGGPGENQVTTIEVDGTARVWDISGKSTLQSIVAMKVLPGSVSVTREACRMATGAGLIVQKADPVSQTFSSGIDAQPIRLWNLADGSQLNGFFAQQPIRSMAFNADGTLLAAATGDYKILLFDIANRSSNVLHSFSRNALDVAFSPNGRYLAAAGDSQVVLFQTQ